LIHPLQVKLEIEAAVLRSPLFLARRGQIKGTRLVFLIGTQNLLRS
jgi:hypothetical protein